MCSAVLVGHGEHQIRPREVVSHAVPHDGLRPPIGEGLRRLEPERIDVTERGEVGDRPACYAHGRETCGEEHRSGGRLAVRRVRPWQPVPHSHSREQAALVPCVVEEQSHRERKPLRLGLVSGVVGGSRRRQEPLAALLNLRLGPAGLERGLRATPWPFDCDTERQPGLRRADRMWRANPRSLKEE